VTQGFARQPEDDDRAPASSVSDGFPDHVPTAASWKLQTRTKVSRVARLEALTALVILCLLVTSMPTIRGMRRPEQLGTHATSAGLNRGFTKFSAVVPRRGSRRGTRAVGGGTTRSFVHFDSLLIPPASGPRRAMMRAVDDHPPCRCFRPASGIPAGHRDRTNDRPAPELGTGACPLPPGGEDPAGYHWNA
jgi:hypothetical protein